MSAANIEVKAAYVKGLAAVAAFWKRRFTPWPEKNRARKVHRSVAAATKARNKEQLSEPKIRCGIGSLPCASNTEEIRNIANAPYA